jgi:hypothetical protein
MSKEKNKEYDKLKNNIIKYNNTLWLPENKIKYEINNLNTWFDFNIILTLIHLIVLIINLI